MSRCREAVRRAEVLARCPRRNRIPRPSQQRVIDPIRTTILGVQPRRHLAVCGEYAERLVVGSVARGFQVGFDPDGHDPVSVHAQFGDVPNSPLGRPQGKRAAHDTLDDVIFDVVVEPGVQPPERRTPRVRAALAEDDHGTCRISDGRMATVRSARPAVGGFDPGSARARDVHRGADGDVGVRRSCADEQRRGQKTMAANADRTRMRTSGYGERCRPVQRCRRSFVVESKEIG